MPRKIRKSDQEYKIVKSRTAKATTPRTFDGLTFYRTRHFSTLSAAKKFAASHVKLHNMVRILDLGKQIGSGKTKAQYFIYSRSIPYSVYSKW